MVRTISAVVGGYLAMAIAVFVSFTLYFLLLGVEGAYQPGSYAVTLLWLIGSIVLSVAAAILGGWACRKIGRTAQAPQILAGVVLVLGLIMAFVAGSPDPSALARPEGVSVFDAASNSVSPTWLNYLNPIIGALGVLIGAGQFNSKTGGGDS